MYPNVDYFRGHFLSIDHLDLLNLRKCHHVLITTELEKGDDQFPDAIGLCLTKILLDHYETSSFLLELKEETKMSFLNNIPKL